MKLTFWLYALPLALAAEPPTTTTTGPIYTIPCVLGNPGQCPTGSSCTQTMTCGGLCIPTPTTNPPQQPCTIGTRNDCPPSSTCTPTMTCGPNRPCGGLCIATQTPVSLTPCTIGVPSQCPAGAICTPAGASPSGLCITTTPPYTVSCILGGAACPTGSMCTQTETCGGLCIPTAPAEIPCRVHGRNHCPHRSTCTPTMSCHKHGFCGGLCIAEATPTP